MSEQLAIKTDDDWRRLDRVIRTLSPRSSDEGRKSSWAHYSMSDSIPSAEVLAEPSETPRLLQALYLFFQSELHKGPGEASRSHVKGVSIVRESISACEVQSDRQPHLMRNREELHRSLVIEDRERVERTAQEIIEKKAATAWKYSRTDMANLLRHMLVNDCVVLEMQSSAWSILAQWDAAS